MRKPSIDRILPCVFALALAACNPSTSPPASNAPVAAASVAAAPAPVAAASPTAPTPAQPAASASTTQAPEISQLDLLDIGVATSQDTLTSLRQRYGAENVKDGDVPGAEGEELDGWILYPNDPKRRVYIYLDDTGVHPSLLRILDGESEWQRSDGVRMGLTLTKLVALNGKPIQFSGFGWDYGGTISNWNGGTMEKRKGMGGLTLCPPDFPEDKYPDNYPSGDAEFSSSNGLVVRYPPLVCEFGVSLDNSQDKQ